MEAAVAVEKAYRLERCSPEEAERAARALEPGADQAPLAELLSPAELALAAGFPAAKRRRDWLAGRLAAKRLLRARFAEDGRDLGLAEIEVLPASDGSPFVRVPGAAVCRYPLSLAHSAAGGIAALGRPGARVGVDLERVEPRGASFLRLISSADEWTPGMERDPAEQTRLWTLKEAVAKLLGTGLSVPFAELCFPLAGPTRRLALFGAARARWETLGRPVIRFECVVEGQDALSVAYTERGAP